MYIYDWCYLLPNTYIVLLSIEFTSFLFNLVVITYQLPIVDNIYPWYVALLLKGFSCFCLHLTLVAVVHSYFALVSVALVVGVDSKNRGVPPSHSSIVLAHLYRDYFLPTNLLIIIITTVSSCILLILIVLDSHKVFSWLTSLYPFSAKQL